MRLENPWHNTRRLFGPKSPRPPWRRRCFSRPSSLRWRDATPHTKKTSQPRRICRFVRSNLSTVFISNLVNADLDWELVYLDSTSTLPWQSPASRST